MKVSNSHTLINQNSTSTFQNIGAIEPEKAARIVGISWVAMFILAIPTVLLILEKLVVSGDTAASLANIKEHEVLLYVGIGSYLCILVLDATIAIGLYSILKFVNKQLALIMTILRLLFVFTTATSLIALGFLQIEFYEQGTLLGYVFLIPHLFLVGILIIRSWYLSSSLGSLLVIGSGAYIITIFGKYLLPSGIMVILYPLAMIPASLAEISLGIYLILKAKHLDEAIDY